MRLFGTSGIRALFDERLVHLALKAGLAVGQIYGEVVVGSDTRTSSETLKYAVIAGLLAAGARCEDAGVVPTPTLALATRKFRAGGMVTASHNPPQYNGLKFLNPDGSSFVLSQQRQLEEAISRESIGVAPWDRVGKMGFCRDAIDQHLDRILSDFPDRLKLKVVLDCGCGAASVITSDLLKKLGCEVVELNCISSGFFPREIEPTEANLRDLIQATKELGADLGIAHDGDADRMMAVDEKGRFISGDKLLIILARAVKAKEIVTTIDASMVIEEMGCRVRRTKVGDTYVSEELKSGGDFGGEPSGSWIFPRVSLCPDGIYAVAQIVVIASEQGLSSLVDGLPAYPLLRGSLSSDGVVLSELESRLMSLKPLSISNLDGIRLNFSDGWLLVRPSGTEPKIRLTAEARTEARVRQLYAGGVQVIKRGQRSKEKVS